MLLNHVDHKERESNGRHLERDTFTLGEHYRVTRFVTTYEDGEVIKNYSVSSDDEYMPEIYYDDCFGLVGRGKPAFKIQTCAYGAKSVDEIEKIIAGYQEAVEAVKVLTLNFC